MKEIKRMSRVLAIMLVLAFAVSLVACETSFLQGKEAIPLSAPTNLRVSDAILKWNPIEQAIGYTVEIKVGTETSDGVSGEEVMVSSNEYSLASLSDGVYSLRVKARGDSVIYSSSEYCGWIEYTRKSDTGEDYKDEVSGAFGSFDEINTRESYLGYGIDIINATGVTSKNIKTTYPIFSKNAILGETLLKSNEHYSNLETIEASTIEEFKTKMAVSSSISSGASVSASANIAGVHVGGGVSFSNGFKTAFEQTSEETHSQYFLEIIAENQNYWLMLQSDENRYRELLSEEFKKDLYNRNVSPATLFDKYGTHLLTSVAMGGNISMFYTLYSTQEGVTTDQYYEVSASLKTNADVAYGGFSAGTSTENNWQNSESYQTIANKYGIRVEKKIVVSGGSGDFGIINEASLLNNYKGWQESLDIYPVVVGIKDSNSLYPIWNLIDTSIEGGAERYQELYNYFAEYGQESYNSLCEAYGIVAPVPPTDIKNINVKTYTDYQEGEIVQIKAGEKFQITFEVLPEDANKYKKTFRSDSEYVIIDESGNVTVSADIPNQFPVAVTVTAGPVEKTISLVAIATCNVVFNTVVSDITVPSLIGINSATTISAPSVSREGYVLEGWYRDANYTSEFIFDSDLVVTNLVLYAKWKAIKPVVKFVVNGGSNVEDQILAYKGTIQEPIDPTKDGYLFSGWYLDKELTLSYDFREQVKSDVILYARWDKIIYTIKFETNGGTPIADKFTDIDRNYKITESKTERTNFVFAGWYLDGDFFTEFTFNDKVTGNITLYAKWEAIKPVITFETNGGSEIESQTIAFDSNVKEPNSPVMDGYKFIGWYKDKELTEKFDFTNPIIANTTLYAKWEKQIYTVTFETNGGTPVSQKTTSVDKKYLISEPETYRTHYTFDGWYLDEDFDVRFYFNERVTSNITLYAKWSVVNVIVSFFDEDGNDSLIAIDGEPIKTRATNYLMEYKIDSVPAPYKKGYVFVGWTMGGINIDVNSYEFKNENASYKIYAKWLDEKYANPITIKINYLYEDGTVAHSPYINSTDYYYDEEYKITSPVINGYAASDLVVQGIVAKDDIEITVIYKQAPYSINITYVMADGSTAPAKEAIPILYGEKYSISVNSIKGYTADKAVLTGTMGAQDVNVTITYTPNKYSLTITYVMADGSIAPEKDVYYVDYNGNYSFTVEKIAGYSSDISIIDGKMSDSDKNVLVTYMPNEYTVTIKYVVADGSVALVDTVQKYKHNEGYSIAIDSIKGFTPDKSVVSGTINANNVLVTVTYKQNSYVVKYDGNGGSGTTTQTSHVYNEEGNLAVSSFTRSSYVFMGWDTEPNGTGIRYTNGQAVKNLTSEKNGVITLYAQWAALIFNANSDNAVPNAPDSSKKVKTQVAWNEYTGTIVSGAMYQLTVPTAQHYKFIGWYTSDGVQLTDGTGKSIAKWTLTKETVLYAKWEQEKTDYVYVKTLAEFVAIENNLEANYMLVGDIDLKSIAQWNSFGGNYANSAFTGTFDGNGHAIKNLSRTSDIEEINSRIYFGLFGFIGKTGVVKNLVFTDVNVSLTGPAVNNSSTRVYCGIVAARVEGTVENIQILNGKFSYSCCTNGVSFVGSIAGYAEKAIISNCQNNAELVSGRYGSACGGFAGWASDSKFNDCINTGSITAWKTNWGGTGRAEDYVGETGTTANVFNNCSNTGKKAVYGY